MTQDYAIVIDKNGYRVEVVATEQCDGASAPRFYALQDGESLVFTDVPDMLNPQWDGDSWMETAEPEEIDADKIRRKHF